VAKLRSEEVLDSKGVDYRLMELEERALSIEDVIRYSKDEINVDEICKTMILKDQEGEDTRSSSWGEIGWTTGKPVRPSVRR
jgi:hypothetical protein